MRSKLGFTLMESIAVVGILLALSSILYPVFLKAKGAGYRAACQSNLRQIYVQTMLYRADWDGDGKYGDSYTMGLPPIWVSDRLPLFRDLKCHDAGNEMFAKGGTHYYAHWLDPDIDKRTPNWEQYSLSENGTSILFSDLNHNDKSKPLVDTEFITHLALGIRENGSSCKILRKGDWLNLNWWNNK